MRLLYQDNLPPETKQLADFVEGFKDKEENKESLIEEFKKRANDKLNYCKTKLLPEEGADQSKITKMRRQQFEQDDEKRMRTNKD